MPADRRLGLVDRWLYALFAHHAEGSRHHKSREWYRAANPETAFALYLARLYGLAWTALLVGLTGTLLLSALIPESTLRTLTAGLRSALPLLNRIQLPAIPPALATVVWSVGVGLLCRWATLGLGDRYLAAIAAGRRADIAATLPGAVRYLRVLASGTHDQRELLRAVAQQGAYGETAAAFRRVLNRATLTGSLDEGLERVASETPSRRASEGACSHSSDSSIPCNTTAEGFGSTTRIATSGDSPRVMFVNTSARFVLCP